MGLRLVEGVIWFRFCLERIDIVLVEFFYFFVSVFFKFLFF